VKASTRFADRAPPLAVSAAFSDLWRGCRAADDQQPAGHLPAGDRH
jgi:hypothetical protein